MIKSDKNSYSSVYDETTSIGKIMKGTLKVYEAFKRLIASGVPPITLQKCKNANLVDYKIYGESIQQLLPSEYQQVEYIESTGTQCIDTGFIPNQNTSVRLEYALTKKPDAQRAMDGNCCRSFYTRRRGTCQNYGRYGGKNRRRLNS